MYCVPPSALPVSGPFAAVLGGGSRDNVSIRRAPGRNRGEACPEAVA
ncbi:hypothetical protein SLNWT_1801 [Streptomyces albus]|uniref:Uncharacterized protein n=1 Tax=Streptomyces albus (strain ATCC 21838 / DSM 41398 / FERM P-419 / JCM 4703 / NBRC 107858) TaxID=1081613 RepID=A0A0B5EVL7_STRA4|nr:hypothetical protein SLNWT_1801 [Streptomyces albus]AOU76492.1 hypothetical protein SLNHY_1801 [Streptomyces albus]AYN32278.1 hypothetical protein DUI70_1774 [Streptomyces albus]